MKRFFSILGIALLLFLTVGCQSGKHAEKNWNLIYVQEFVDDYNRIVVELSKKEGLDDPELLTLSKEAERLDDDGYVATGSFYGAKYPQLSAVISSNKGIMISLSYNKVADNTPPYKEKLAEIAFTAAIEMVKPGKSLEIEQTIQLRDKAGNFYLPNNESDSKNFTTDGLTFIYSNNNKGCFIMIDPELAKGHN